MAASILHRPSCVACPGSGRGEGAHGTRSDLLRPWCPYPDELRGSCRPFAHLRRRRPGGARGAPGALATARGAAHLPSPAPRAPESPPPWRRRARAPARSDASILRRPRPQPSPSLPVGGPLPLAPSRRAHSAAAAVRSVRRWEPGRARAGPGRSRRLSGKPSAGRPGRPGRGRAGAWPGAAACGPGQHDRRQQHPQQRWAAALALAVLCALRAHPPRRGDPVLRLAAALAQSQARALHRPGGQPPAEPQEEEGGEGVGAAAHARLGGGGCRWCCWRAAWLRGRCEGGSEGGSSPGGMGRTEGGRAQWGQSPWVARSGHGLEGEGQRRAD